ncbi:hypothetical protein O9K51_04629 [Purpureocillium lavendulum]|uniref:Uncharacterized protein n=1 Tax=Purpureocillium lavendulum TaxID=1247861 RepID=A0AB34FWT5_9HYPO|nr:hypothetical protein O9K51_04629 [Purpureocillium lavendulum]
MASTIAAPGVESKTSGSATTVRHQHPSPPVAYTRPSAVHSPSTLSTAPPRTYPVMKEVSGGAGPLAARPAAPASVACGAYRPTARPLPRYAPQGAHGFVARARCFPPEMPRDMHQQQQQQ